MKLTDTQRAILEAAAAHPERLAYPPERLPAGARQAVAKALLKHDLVVAVQRPAHDAIATWPVDGDTILLQITDAGLRAIGVEPAEDEPADEASARNPEMDTSYDGPEPAACGIEGSVSGSAPAANRATTGGEDATGAGVPAEAADPARTAPRGARRASLRDAAAAVLAAWDGDTEEARLALPEAISALRAALADTPLRRVREPGAPRKPRAGTKQETVLAMLRREEGATIAQIVAATGWQPHTVRGFFAGLKRRQGITVIAAERIRQVGPNKEGAKGSFSIYRIAE